MVQDYSTINKLDQFEATQYILQITMLPIITVKATLEEKKRSYFTSKDYLRHNSWLISSR
jgi:hypothetical protein